MDQKATVAKLWNPPEGPDIGIEDAPKDLRTEQTLLPTPQVYERAVKELKH